MVLVGANVGRQLLRIAIALAGIAVCSSLAAQALQSLHAEVLQLSSSHSARHGHWLAASDASQRALTLAPGEYRYREQAAYVEEGLGRPQHAHALWLAALEQRPGWPYAWAQLARWQLDHGDAASGALQLSLRQVSRFGAQERGLRKAFAQEALQHWDDALPPPVRVYLRDALRREYHERAHNVGGYAFVRHQEAVLCRIFDKDPGMGELPGWCDVVRYVRSSCESGMPLTSKHTKWCEDQVALWSSMDYRPE